MTGHDFADNEFVLITVPEIRWPSAAGWRWRSLANRSWLVREEGSGTRTLCLEYLARVSSSRTC